MYIKRHIEKAFNERMKWNSAIVVTGARQVGKTTLIEYVVPDIPKVELDDKLTLEMAKNSTLEFMELNPPPVFIDEVQYATEIFPYIKMAVDKSKKKGQFFLSGSQPFKLMKNISESLTGRAGILTMYGLSMREINKEDWNKPFLPTKEYLLERKKSHTETPIKEIWNTIWRGSYPELYEKPDYPWEIFYSDYLKTYLERDIRDLARIGDEMQFLQFLRIIAARTGQILNLSDIAKEVQISVPTVKHWISILETSGIIYLLLPYHNNLNKRIIKSPKIYFTDTGLSCYLARWNTPESLMTGAMNGAYFETFIINEIMKSYINNGKEAELYFFRDSNGVEIDLLIYENGTLYPLEIKCTSEPNHKMIKAFDLLDNVHGVKRGEGGVICLSNLLLPLKDNDKIIPTWAI